MTVLPSSVPALIAAPLVAVLAIVLLGGPAWAAAGLGVQLYVAECFALLTLSYTRDAAVRTRVEVDRAIAATTDVQLAVDEVRDLVTDPGL